MWKRDAAVKPASGQPGTAGTPNQQAPIPVESADPRRYSEGDMVHIGKSIVIKGELNGSEDLTVEGHVEGTIQLRENVLTIGSHGKINAQVFAKSVIVQGAVYGHITASEKVDIRDGGSVDGDIVSPRVAIAEGARFRGSVDMSKKGAQPVQQSSASTQPKPAQPSGSVGQPPGQPMAAAGAH